MNQLSLTTMSEVQLAATAMANSGYFQDARQAAQAVVKILAGQEMGFGPFASMTGVYIIQGRPAIGANLMAAAVKKHPKYDDRVIKMQDDVCELAFFQDGQEIGRSVFDLDNAKKAGTKNLDKFARNMLFARAMSNGVRWFVPDVFLGAAVYTPEELGASVNEAGEIVDVMLVGPPHWSERQDQQGRNLGARFFNWTSEKRLTHEDALEALGIGKLVDYTGTMQEAKDAVEKYIEDCIQQDTSGKVGLQPIDDFNN